MEITDELVRHLEALASLQLDSSARARMRADLERIVEYVRQLETLDTEDVPSTTTCSGSMTLRLRADDVRESLPREALLGNAPDARDGLYRVPRVLGGEDAREGEPS